MDLSEFANWNVLAMKWERGEKIEKQTVLAELRSGRVPTEKALPMLVDMLTDSGQFINGKKKCVYDSSGSAMQPAIAWLVLRYEKVFKWQEKRNPTIKKNRMFQKNGQTPRKRAKELTANRFGISVRKVEEYLNKHENWIKECWMS